MQVVKLELYKNSEGHLVNNLGERVDELGRVTKARGAKGLGSRKKKMVQVVSPWPMPATGGVRERHCPHESDCWFIGHWLFINDIFSIVLHLKITVALIDVSKATSAYVPPTFPCRIERLVSHSQRSVATFSC
jgi:hypothetical protein